MDILRENWNHLHKWVIDGSEAINGLNDPLKAVEKGVH